MVRAPGRPGHTGARRPVLRGREAKDIGALSRPRGQAGKPWRRRNAMEDGESLGEKLGGLVGLGFGLVLV